MTQPIHEPLTQRACLVTRVGSRTSCFAGPHRHRQQSLAPGSCSMHLGQTIRQQHCRTGILHRCLVRPLLGLGDPRSDGPTTTPTSRSGSGRRDRGLLAAHDQVSEGVVHRWRSCRTGSHSPALLRLQATPSCKWSSAAPPEFNFDLDKSFVRRRTGQREPSELRHPTSDRLSDDHLPPSKEWGDLTAPVQVARTEDNHRT